MCYPHTQQPWGVRKEVNASASTDEKIQ